MCRQSPIALRIQLSQQFSSCPQAGYGRKSFGKKTTSRCGWEYWIGVVLPKFVSALRAGFFRCTVFLLRMLRSMASFVVVMTSPPAPTPTTSKLRQCPGVKRSGKSPSTRLVRRNCASTASSFGPILPDHPRRRAPHARQQRWHKRRFLRPNCPHPPNRPQWPKRALLSTRPR